MLLLRMNQFGLLGECVFVTYTNLCWYGVQCAVYILVLWSSSVLEDMISHTQHI